MLTKSELHNLSKLNYTTEPTIAVGLTGVTQLHSITYKTRFIGSKRYIVDRDGEILEKCRSRTGVVRKLKSSNNRKYRINKKRVRHIILNWINNQKHRKQLYFITISFPKNIPDNTAYKALNSWLTTLRQSRILTHYLWIAERQKNGTIHYHLATSNRINIVYANQLMRQLLHHYIRKKLLNWNHSGAAKYNGVDLAKNRKTGKVTNFASHRKSRLLSAYFTKYVTKSDSSFEHQAWNCSNNLSSLFTHYTMTLEEFENRFLKYIDLNECLITCEQYNFFRWMKSPPIEVRILLNHINDKVSMKTSSQPSQSA